MFIEALIRKVIIFKEHEKLAGQIRFLWISNSHRSSHLGASFTSLQFCFLCLHYFKLCMCLSVDMSRVLWNSHVKVRAQFVAIS